MTPKNEPPKRHGGHVLLKPQILGKSKSLQRLADQKTVNKLMNSKILLSKGNTQNNQDQKKGDFASIREKNHERYNNN